MTLVSKRLRCTAVLEDFVRYCNVHPQLRFWQALLNWSGQPFILISSAPVHEAGDGGARFTDPYNWEGKDR